MITNSAAKLWNWQNENAAVSAKQNKVLHIEAIHSIRIRSNETVTQYVAHVLTTRDKLMMGGGNMDGLTLLMPITHVLPYSAPIKIK